MIWNSLKDIKLFQYNGMEINIFDIVLIIVLVVAGILVSRLFLRLINIISDKKHISKRFTHFLRQGVRLFVWLSAFLFFLEILGLSVPAVMDHDLFHINKDSTFRVFNVFVILVILYLVRAMVFVVEYWFDVRIENKKIDKGRGRSFMQIVKYVVWMIGLIIVIGSFGFKVTWIIASVSALLIGVGFGLQNIFNDFFSGIIILFDGSIEVDDVVEVEGVVGRVLDIGLRVSKLLTRDNLVIIVPNSKFTGDRIINWTHNEEVTRFDVPVGVAYGSDVRLVERILLEVAKKHKQIETIPSPFVRFNDFGESSLDFQLFFWTANDFLVENIKSDLRFDIDAEFRSNKVEIPFPQRDLHFKSKHFE
ncbi:MAG TPA: mechanosensitive ion channel domain-containing protein [Sunxiuqinia sp.]|nr:mechanosensitive ion channel domain-containing protein [Sunxiuqinia sp.]